MSGTSGLGPAEHLYKSLFAGGVEKGVPYYERSTSALRDAEAEEKGRGHPGVLGEFCSLWRLTGVCLREFEFA